MPARIMGMQLRHVARRMIAAHGYDDAVRQAREVRHVLEELDTELGGTLAVASLAASRLVLAIHAEHRREEKANADH